MPSTRTSSARLPTTDHGRIRVVEDTVMAGSSASGCRTVATDSAATVAGVRDQILNAPKRGLVLSEGNGQGYGWSTNAGGRAIRLVGPLAAPAVEWIDWDRQTARISAGATVAGVSETLLAEGWCLPSLVGNPQRTIAAMVSGALVGPHQLRHPSIGQAIRAIELVDGSGELRRLEPTDSDSRGFWAVVGGVGLLGVPTAVELAIRPVSSSWLLVDSVQYDSFDGVVDALCNETADRYGTAVLDVSARGSRTGRGTVRHARHARVNELPPTRQHVALAYNASADGGRSSQPIQAIQRTRVGRLLAEARYRASAPRTDNELAPLAEFFHRAAIAGPSNTPDWGWIKYDFCVPTDARELVTDFIRAASTVGVPISAAQLTRVDSHQAGPLGWPSSGFAASIRLPLGASSMPTLLDTFDERIAEARGCIQLATDTRMRPDVLAQMYPRLAEWHSLRAEFDPHSSFNSDLARRLAL